MMQRSEVETAANLIKVLERLDRELGRGKLSFMIEQTYTEDYRRGELRIAAVLSKNSHERGQAPQVFLNEDAAKMVTNIVANAFAHLREQYVAELVKLGVDL